METSQPTILHSCHGKSQYLLMLCLQHSQHSWL